MVGLQILSSSERCPLFRVSFIERFPCIVSSLSLVVHVGEELSLAVTFSPATSLLPLPSRLSPSLPPTPLPSPPLLSLPFLSVQFALLSSSQEVRAGGLRVLKYLLVTKEIFQVMLDHCIDQLVVRYSRAGPLRAFRQLLHASNGKALSLLIRYVLPLKVEHVCWSHMIQPFPFLHPSDPPLTPPLLSLPLPSPFSPLPSLSPPLPLPSPPSPLSSPPSCRSIDLSTHKEVERVQAMRFIQQFCQVESVSHHVLLTPLTVLPCLCLVGHLGGTRCGPIMFCLSACFHSN